MKTPFQFYEPTLDSPNWPGFKSGKEFKGQDAWSLNLYKYGLNWATNFWSLQKFDEELLNGSEKCLDYWFTELTNSEPNWQSAMKATFTPKLLDGFTPTTTLTYLEPWQTNPNASWYLDEGCQMKWWLCPLWLDLWPDKTAPKTCYLYLADDSF